jgi:ribosomal protein L37E
MGGSVMKKPDVAKLVADWSKKKKLKPKCGLCGSREFHQAGMMCSLPDSLTNTILDVVPLVCANCGYVVFVAATAL